MSSPARDRGERADHAPGPVDVVHPPAAEPGTPWTLRARGGTRAPTATSASSVPRAGGGEHLHDMRRDVLARRVEHRAEVGERQPVHELSRVVLVEGRPRAVARAHRATPSHRIGDRFRDAVRLAGLEQRQHHDRGVVDVRVDVVVEFECPPAAPVERHLHLPVTAARDLLGEHPVDRAAERRVLARKTGLAQREHRPRRVPDRGHARLQAPAVPVVDGEAAQPLETTPHDGVVEAHALEVERDQRVHPRGLDAAPAPVGLLALGDPLHETAPRRGAARLHGKPLVQLLQVVEPDEGTGAGNAMEAAGGARGDELIDADAEVAHRPAGDDDEQRCHGSPCPAGEVVEVERRPGGQPDQLGGHARHAVPRVRAEQREPDLGEDACLAHPTLIEDEAQGPAQLRLRGIEPEHAQRDVRLDRRAEVAGRLVIQAPRCRRRAGCRGCAGSLRRECRRGQPRGTAAGGRARRSS